MRKILILFILTIFVSCKTTGYNLNLIFKNANGLRSDTPVICDEKTIGKIASIDLTKENLIFVRLKIDPTIKIPTSSSFNVVDMDAFGTKAIVIEYGQGNAYFQKGDTVIGNNVKYNYAIVKNNIDSILQVIKADTVLMEVFPFVKDLQVPDSIDK